MLIINDLSHQVGTKVLYSHASLHIKPKDKIGLVGLNGTGKSTLLKIMSGNLTPDRGTINRHKHCSVGFLNQDLLSYQTSESIRNVAMQAFEHAMALQKKIDGILRQMGYNNQEALVDQLATLQMTFEELGGYALQAKTDTVLEGMGFSTQDLEQPLHTFSGGWRMRVMLAKLLLQAPSLLLLDEPTNHLDITSIQWVGHYLQHYAGAFVVVSHDRSFLDQVSSKTIEVDQQRLHAYMGNYTFYEQEKAARISLQQNAHIKEQQKVKQVEAFVARFRAKASKAKQVQSRIKALERMDRTSPPATVDAQVKWKWGSLPQPGKIVASLTQIDKTFGSQRILHHASAQVERHEKIALIGANGQGKSTLLRIMAEQEPYEAGTYTLGNHVSPAFYAQHQLEALDLSNTVLMELQQANVARTEQELRRVAGMFLFAKDDVFKKIKVLSGGEKSRVALAKIFLVKANFLLLDEPTNHLDVISIHTLAQALRQYPGTFVLVSHDRHFIAQVATKIWYIVDQKIKVYPGTYEEYTYGQQRNSL